MPRPGGTGAVAAVEAGALVGNKNGYLTPEEGLRRGFGSGVGAAAARDHIYRRLEELRRIILSERGARREEARKERAFLERELAKVLRKGRGTVRLDPELERAIRRKVSDPPRTFFPTAPARPRADSQKKVSVRRPPYWAICEKMDFRELREFIDDSLHGPQEPNGRDHPRSKSQFLNLQELLAKRGGVELEGVAASTPASADEDVTLRKMRTRRKALAKKLAEAQRDLSKKKGKARGAPEKIRNLRQDLELLRSKIDRLEAQEKGRLAKPRTEAQRLRQIKARRREIVGRIGRDIERAFAAGGLAGSPLARSEGATVGARRLPWRMLPPGELSLQRVLAHYEKLGRVRPDVRYEPERIRRAYSLGPDGCFVGADEFDGYVVFTFPGTRKALLERPVYGNAVYVLGSDWKRLSRMSKRDFLADGTLGVTKIVHRGDWFLRVVNALGLR